MTSPNRQAPKKPQRRFQFIDNSNVGAPGSNSTQVRRHVMQEYMREKRWESRTQAEEELLDFSARPQLRHQDAPFPPRKSTPKSRSKTRTSASPEGTASIKASVPQNQPAVSRLSEYHLQPQTQNSQPPPHFGYEAIEEIPRTVVPSTKKESKRPRRGFYLTPQSFASIADLNDIPPPTPASTIISGASLSPTSSCTPSSSGGSVGRWVSSSPEPSSTLSAARTDPFDCLPMVLSRQDQELFDFYATVMPACSYGFQRRNPRAHNWYISVFIPEAMKSPVAFQNTILVHAANTQAWVRGVHETRLSIEHRARASKMLSEHFQEYPYDTSDAAISSTLSAAALEDFDPRPERRQYAWMHWYAAMRKVRDRGGPAALEQNTSLRMLINWSDYIFSGYHGHGSTFFFHHQLSPKHSNDVEAQMIARNELRRQCEDFIIFLRCAESLALVAANMQSNPTARKNQPMRYGVFASGQPLHTLLASSNGPRYTETGQLKQIISRLAALMTISVAIWEYRYSTSVCEEFFRELLENVKYNDLDQHISVEALLQILLSDSKNPVLVHTERPWLVGRLLKVAKRLSRRSWERLNDFLLECLMLGPSLKPVMDVWEHELRAEILSAPLVSYVLPLMQPS